MAWSKVDNIMGPPGPTDYVALDARYVNLDGDTMSGALIVPTVSGVGASLALVGGSTGVIIDGNGVRSGMFRDGILWIGDIANAAGNSSAPLRLYGTSSSDQMQFFHGAAPQSLSGRVGFVSATELRLQNDLGASGLISLWNLSGDCRIGSGGSETARFLSDRLCVGKTVNDQAVVGTVMANQFFQATSDVLGVPGFAVNKTGAGNATGCVFSEFRRGTNVIGTITSPGAGVTAYNTSSDYRIKDERGPIERPLERIKVLRPLRAHFHAEADPALEVETFIAHEVAEVVPGAVTGEKDALDEEDAILPQQLDVSKLVPLLVAAVQELTVEVEQLRAEVAQLKGAA